MKVELDCLTVTVSAKGKIGYESNVVVELDLTDEQSVEYASRGFFIVPSNGKYELYAERLNGDTMTLAVAALQRRLN